MPHSPLLSLGISAVVAALSLTTLQAVAPDKSAATPHQIVGDTPYDGNPARTTNGARSGTGLVYGELPVVNNIPVGPKVWNVVRTSVANIPNSTSRSAFDTSMRRLVSAQPDFIALNEVSGRTMADIRKPVPGYQAYRDPVRDTSEGGVQSMNNVVMWRSPQWSLIDGGRVKIVDDDRGYHQGRKFNWDRYATWVALRHTNGAVMSVISTHQMTNPGKYPRQWGGSTPNRVAKYAAGMDLLHKLAWRLSRRGPVMMAGDMNSHLSQGSWSAPAKMRAARYGWSKNQGVLYHFFPNTAELRKSGQVKINSTHPALTTVVRMKGTAPR